MNRSDLIRAMIDLGKVIETIEGIEGIKPKIKRRDIAALEAIITDYARQLAELVDDETTYGAEYGVVEELGASYTPGCTRGFGVRIALVDELDERP